MLRGLVGACYVDVWMCVDVTTGGVCYVGGSGRVVRCGRVVDWWQQVWGTLGAVRYVGGGGIVVR